MLFLGFNLSKRQDVDNLLNLLENGTLSDLDGESDDEIVQPIPEKNVRVGSNITRPNEIVTADQSEEEEDLAEQEELQAGPSNEAKKGIIWRKHLQFQAPQFIWSSPPISEIDTPLAPIDYFSKYITESLYEDLTFNTNLYAVRNEVRNFKPCTSTEIKIFLGLHIIMGNLKFPRIRLYWDSSLDMKIFLENMTRDRFFQIRNNLHIIDNNSIPQNNTDRLIKVRPLYDMVRKRCLELNLEQILSVDEQIVPFRGKLEIKQYIKGKPEPWGVKIFMICGKSGLIYDFIIYQGATTNLDRNDVLKYGASAAYVNELSKRINGSGYYLFFDNYFSNYNLLKDLRERQIYAGGTIRINRFGKPPLITDKDGSKKDRGYTDQVTNSTKDVVVIKWMDNKGVVLASNFIGIGNEDEVRRWNKVSKKYITIPRPELVRLYNNGMGGVDKTDQLISLYRIFIRSKKWTLRMIFHAVDLALTNSWLEYQNDCKTCNIPSTDILDLLHFRQRVAEALIKMGQSICSRKRGRPASGSSSPAHMPVNMPAKRNRFRNERRPAIEIQYDTVDHLPEYDKKKEATRCKKTGCKGKTHVYCKKCEIHLCFTSDRNCFRTFHQK